MTKLIISAKLWRVLRAFPSACDGNIAVTFGIVMIPVFGLVGAALDYSRASSVRAQMQAAMDATALMLSKEVAGLSESEMMQKANDYYNTMFTRPDATNKQLTATYDSTAGTLTLNGSAAVRATITRLIGKTEMDIATSAMVKWKSDRLRVALVLDNTGSMSSAGKITALKTATTSLLTTLRNAATTNGDVYVSITPFAVHVNADPANYTQTWIDWTQWEAPPAGSMPSGSVGPGSSCPYSSSSDGFKCAASPVNDPNCNLGANNTCVGTIPSSGTYAGYICPSADNGSKIATKGYRYYNGCYNSVPTWSCTGSSCSCSGRSSCTCSGSGSSTVCTQTPYTHTWIPNNHNTWTGCIMDRGTTTAPGTNAGYDQTVDAPSAGTPATLFPADQYAIPCPQTVMGLSYDWTALNNVVNNMNPNGATNQPLGLVWGWMSLVGGGPLTAPAKAPGYNYQTFIILLSDGLNTQDRWYGNGSATNTQVDGRMYNAANTGTCQNIKAAGIVIYTVQVNTGGDPTSTLLQNCASTSDKFFMLTSSNQIVTTFNQIGNDIAKLRIAR